MKHTLRILFALSLCWGSGVKGLLAQSTRDSVYVLDELADQIDLNDHLMVLKDAAANLPFDRIERAVNQDVFHPYSSIDKPLDKQAAYWGQLLIRSELPQKSRWILYNSNIGLVDFYWRNAQDSLIHYPTGLYQREALKEISEGRNSIVPFELLPGEERRVYVRIQELDHSSPYFQLRLYEPEYWYLNSQYRLRDTINFFLGIFLIIALYNLVLFFTLRFRAYLYYVLYLLCVATFVAFAVGPMAEPPFGNPVRIIPIGYLAFGAINVFYFLFGRNFLDTPTLIPRWDSVILRYVQMKVLVLIGVQIMLYSNFNLQLAVGIEFGMMGLDMLFTMALFVVLLKTRSRLAYYFIAGSASVVIFGLSLAIIGYVFAFKHAFEMFLGSIVVEIIFFSLGLGYRIRLTERQKLAAEREHREAQELLNNELSKINTAFGRFVPHEFLKSLGHTSILDVQLGDGVEKEVTVLFSDIRDYTSLSEEMSPHDNFHFLNSYLGRVGPVIQTYRGFVNQYYGDGIMALFMQGPEDALMAALEINRTLGYYNQERKEKGRRPIKVGIGLHTGPLMMGVMGDTLRLEAGVVADTVNIASRMEGLTKHFGATIILSENTLKGIPKAQRYAHRFLGRVLVKGRKEPLGVYESFGSEVKVAREMKTQGLQAFNAGTRHYYSQQFVEAAQAFNEVLTINPEDKVAKMYVEKAQKCLAEGVPKDWDGVERMVSK